MQFLKTLFWVMLAVIAVIFSTRNWVGVPVSLWGGLAADVKLPVLLFGSFLVGLLPGVLLYRATRWRYRRRLEVAERSLAEARGLVPPPIEEEASMPPGATPMAVPPGAI